MAPVDLPAYDAVLLRQARRQPDRPLFAVAGRPAVTAGEYAALAGRTASVLAAAGVGRGDRIAVWAENSIAWLVLLAAAAWRGAALVTVHPAATEPELAAALRRTRPVRLFAAREIRDRDVTSSARRAATGPVTFLPADQAGDALAGLPGWAGPPPEPARDPDAPLNVQFTSGSTGTPKMVVLTGRNLVRNATWTAQAAGIGSVDRICCPLPFAHAAGLSSGVVLAAVTGAQLFPVPRFRPDDVLDVVHRHQCTVVQLVPTMATMLADRLDEQPRRWDLAALRLGFLGGASCPPALRARVRDTLRLRRLAVVYGQTEAGPTISVDPDDGSCPPDGSTVGRVLPGLRARIVAVDVGGSTRPLPAGAEGELQVRGESVSPGYLDDPAANRAAYDPQGWLRTGDLGRLAADGTLTLTGRVKDLIIRGGENVSPAEVEAFLLTCEGVAQACVVGVASPRWGEEVVAVVVAAPGATLHRTELAAAAAGSLSRHKVPTDWHVVTELPLLPSGKVDRRAVAAMVDGVAR
ncbi:class I adenylate-forming enzyme family protein [Micromonospora sp. LOL_021]|uniref:class I adenylate-forming enzyme family protein n=1 Tax=Micromonospora sp. LOL_021 TaxID=3345417 RepID=UPI003A8A4F68